MKPDYPVTACVDSDTWRQWLASHHNSADGIWLRMYKKASGVPTVTYAEALDQALCFGWIDGQRKTFDELSYIQKFTPRRSKSLWSKRNIEHVARLTQAGLMMPAGQAEIIRAQTDGRWQAAYDAPSNMAVPDDFLQAVARDPQAQANFDVLNKTNRYAIAWRLQTAKTEATRARRFAALLDMVHSGQRLH